MLEQHFFLAQTPDLSLTTPTSYLWLVDVSCTVVLTVMGDEMIVFWCVCVCGGGGGGGAPATFW